VVDRETVQDANTVTARNPDDLPAFMRVFLALVEGDADPSR
jgi:putative intracellular protease/amidase